MAKNSSDPYGHHDWHSKEYVDNWISTDATRDEQRKPILRKVAGLIPKETDSSIRILDVGAGYGALSHEVLQRFRNAELVCQDFSEPMFAHAKERLASYRDRVSFVQGDLMTSDWTSDLGDPFDAVVSAIAIHNVRFPERICAIYGEIAGILKPGGCFLNCDLIFGDGLETQLEWLRSFGLERVECFWEEGRSVIIGGFKAGGPD